MSCFPGMIFASGVNGGRRLIVSTGDVRLGYPSLKNRQKSGFLTNFGLITLDFARDIC